MFSCEPEGCYSLYKKDGDRAILAIAYIDDIGRYQLSIYQYFILKYPDALDEWLPHPLYGAYACMLAAHTTADPWRVLVV